MKKKGWILSAVLCLLAAGLAIVVVRPIRWRAHLVALKASGKIQDVSWSELVHLMARHSGLDSGVMLKTRNPYSAISAPEATPERVRAGRELFNQQCAPCHGVDATGGMAPNLTKGEFVHGASDWGLYKTITRGIPGTPMQARNLATGKVWQLVSFIKDSVAKSAATAAESSKPVIPELNATFERIKGAGKNPEDWLTYSGTYNAQRHSRLSQITRENVGRLRPKWIFQFPKFMRGTECTPIVSGHTMFVTLPPGDLWALDTRTGEKLWSYSYPVSTPVKNTPVHNRGVAVLGNTVFMGTLNAHLIALNAQTGKLLWDVTVGENQDGYGITSAPLALKNEILVGVAGGTSEFAASLTPTRPWMENGCGGFTRSPVPVNPATRPGVTEMRGSAAAARPG